MIDAALNYLVEKGYTFSLSYNGTSYRVVIKDEFLSVLGSGRGPTAEEALFAATYHAHQKTKRSFQPSFKPPL